MVANAGGVAVTVFYCSAANSVTIGNNGSIMQPLRSSKYSDPQWSEQGLGAARQLLAKPSLVHASRTSKARINGLFA
jgi:hypothetical protein